MDETIETGEKVETMTDDYLAAIQQLKQTTVNRSDYDALKAENKKLLDAVLNGAPAPETKHIEEVDTDALYEDMKHATNNRDFCKAMISYVDALVERGEELPFLPLLADGIPSESDKAGAETFLNEIRDCLEVAGDSPEMFDAETMRRTAPGKASPKR